MSPDTILAAITGLAIIVVGLLAWVQIERTLSRRKRPTPLTTTPDKIRQARATTQLFQPPVDR